MAIDSPPAIAIIGAGPSGLIAAETLARVGCAVTLYDRMPSPARKLLMAGRGGLNLTHSEPLDLFLTRYGAASQWLTPAIRSFPPEALRAWSEGLGQETFVGSSGRVFPRCMKAAPLLRAWLQRLEGLGVQYCPRHTWHGWHNESLWFTNATGESVLVQPSTVLLAMGGASWPRLGSDGAWVELLKPYVPVAPLRPSNVGFLVNWSAHLASRFAGAPLKPVAISHEAVTRQGEAMITSRGIEGGVIYALSPALRDAIAQEGQAHIMLDLRPAMTVEALAQKLSAPRGSKSLSSFLRSAGFSPLAVALLREVTTGEQLAAMNPPALAARLKALPLTLTATAGMARAISSAGGIKQEALNEDFMFTNAPGLFAAGEMLDWEAPTGGYLLQACFSTGVAAAKGMLRYLGRG